MIKTIDQALDVLKKSDGPLPQIHINKNLIWLLEADVLREIESILCQREFHGVWFLSYVHDPRIASLETFTFSPWAREKNLWWHLDTFHIPQSVRQRLTVLYSPLWSYSHIPTFTTSTSIVDDRAEEHFPSFWLPDHVVAGYSRRIEGLIGKWTGYYTLLQNVALADIGLNHSHGDAFFRKRDQFTRGILDDSEVLKWEFVTVPELSSLLFFRNGLWPNRGVAHTRFHREGHSHFSVGNIHNISIEQGGIVHTKHQPVHGLPEGILYEVGKFNPNS